ncbi:hypothetical protein [Flavobacterium sp. B17]|uniref:hypothetical protein n=1 Tax=Flavobacterium sp. B17 TaxID=95618 RepID=UPI0005B2D2DA|nr:hypothetical protein [Flavobacterium sp. B17]
MKIQFLYYILIFCLVGCGKDDSNKINYITHNNVFINKSGEYYYKDYKILVKEFNNETLIYGVFGLLRNQCIYQQNLTATFSDYSKWTLYIDDKDSIWFYNSDRDEITVLYYKDKQLIYEFHKDKLPTIPKQLKEFIKS